MKGILILSIVFILCSCNEHPKSHNLIKTRPTIEVEHTKHQLPCWKLKDRSKSSTDFFENQVDSIVLIPLENHKDAIIGSVSHVEIVENKPLARMLYHNVEIGEEIPPELYQAVAEILAYVYGLKNQ